MENEEMVNLFRGALAEAGLITRDPIISDGKLRRFHVEGDRQGRKNGWYILHREPYPMGRFGSWKTGIRETWKAPFPKRLSAQDRRALQKALSEAQTAHAAEMHGREEKTRKEAESIWKHADAAPWGHSYLLAKKISPNGAKINRGRLVLAVRDMGGTIHSLQFISGGGEKRFLADGRTRGCCYGIRGSGKRIYVCEGFATGASIHEATGDSVAIAFHASNLAPVAQAIKEKLRRVEVVIAADNDQWTDGNPGRTKAIEAAKETHSKVALPRFRNTATRPTDFNDLFALEGPDAVKQQLARACKPQLLENVPGVLAHSVKPAKVEWLWSGWIPRAEVTILDGDPGVGKSAFACELAASITTGRAMPGAADGQSLPRGAVFVDLENSLEHTLVPRLSVAGADLARVRIMRSILGPNGNERTPQIPYDLHEIEKAIHDVQADLLVIDPLVGCLPLDTDAHRDQHVRHAIAPLQRLAEQTGVAVLAIRHLNKTGGSNPLYRGGGSIAFIAGARAALLIQRDPNDPTWRVLAATKTSLGPEPRSLRFQLVPSGDSTKVEWGGASPYSAESLLADSGGEEGRRERHEAKEFIRGELQYGPMKATEMFSKGKKHGFTEKTLRRAKADLGVDSHQIHLKGERWWEWSLGQAPNKAGQVATP
ncbi:MAG TPA: AAA family ATPase [Terriglobales bacterium]|nr:AAA family ATPase [Terriglobales bacterium]